MMSPLLATLGAIIHINSCWVEDHVSLHTQLIDAMKNRFDQFFSVKLNGHLKRVELIKQLP